MIGVGWITGLKGMFEQAGPIGTTLAFLAGGTLMVIIGLCYSETMKVLPVTGGEVAYAYKAFSTNKAFLIGWCLALGYLSVSAFEAVSIGIVISYIFDFDWWPLYDIGGSTVYGSHVILAFVFTAAVGWINFLGVGLATRVQAALTLLLVVLSAVFVFAGFYYGDAENLTPAFGSSELSTSLGGILAVFVTVPFWYVGFDTIPQAAEERVEGFPASHLGRVLVLAILGSTIFYALVFVSVGMTAPWKSIIDEPLPTAAAFKAAMGSLFWVRLVLIVGLIGLLTSWNGFFLSGCRVLFAMGRGHIIHASFGRANPKYGTPSAAILFSTLLTFCGALLGKPAVLVFVNVGALCISLAFLGVSLSLIKLRRDSGESVSLPKRVLPYLGSLGSLFIISAMIVPGSPAILPSSMEWIVLGIVVVTGLIFWFGASGIRGEISEEDRRHLILDESKA